ncbi:tRNA pseudouridine(55) synthase TruB [Aestuariimicrobium kwangyangense]|uniref:tRNA pseudouridine(55) synthase TruB n=1 Tax=Aestuariimicrobium kwangyangense TaxID=396389 RepID=UPI0003B34D86|nr:tRNA pseudouridine(55) synthase TruB [Aestuariimicrobium kwangyangense]
MSPQDSSGIVLVDKPQGWTSHQVVGRMRRLLGTRKVGHAGTLDPMATGLLIIGVNRATRLLGHLAGHDKTYVATIRLGQSSSTDDAEGELSQVVPAAHLEAAAIETAMDDLRGDIEQVPSSVSAIKVNGQRAYALVRGGEQVTLRARPVTVARFEVIGRRTEGDLLDLDVVVDCSSGTYIRALARDLGAELEVGGHLTSLRRTRIGGFVLPELTVDLIGDEAPALTSMGEVGRTAFAHLDVSAEQADDVRFGRALELDLSADVPTALISADGDLLALHEANPDRPGWTKPVAVFV